MSSMFCHEVYFYDVVDVEILKYRKPLSGPVQHHLTSLINVYLN